MDNLFFQRLIDVARIEPEKSEDQAKESFFRRDTSVARIDPETLVSVTPTLEQQILENAAGPKRVTGDAGSVEQHSLQDQIALAKFLASQKTAKSGGLGIRLFRISPDGTT